MSTVRSVYKNKGKHGCVDYFKDRLNSDLEYVSNSYKEAVQCYHSTVKDGSDPMELISQSLLDEHRKAIFEHEKHITEFILALHNIPTRNFFSTQLCVFSFILWVIMFLKLILDIKFFFGALRCLIYGY